MAALTSLFSKPKIPKPPAPPPMVTRNMAQEAAMAEDDLRRRRGRGALDRTGGAEASTAGGKTLLGQ